MALNNLRVIYNNLVDLSTTTVTASSTQGTAAVANLKKDQKGLVWRSLPVNPLESQVTAVLTVDLGTAQSVSGVLLPYTNLKSPSATIEIQGYSQPATVAVGNLGSVSLTGGVPVTNYSQTTVCSPWNDLNLSSWGTNPLTSNTYAYGGGTCARVWFNSTLQALSARYLYIIIRDDYANYIAANTRLGLYGTNASGTNLLTLTGTTVTKLTGNDAWNSECYSLDGYASSVACSFGITSTATSVEAGLNTDPTTSAGFGSVDYGFYLPGYSTGTGTIQISENGGIVVANAGTYVLGDIFSIVYENNTVTYYKNSTVLRTVALTSTAKFYFDSSIYRGGLSNIQFFQPQSKYIEASRLIVGKYWSPKYNTGYGMNATIGDLSTHERTESGDLVTQRGPRFSKISFNLDWLEQSDRKELSKILLGNGLPKPLFISLFPDNGSTSAQAEMERAHHIYGTLMQITGINYAMLDTYSTQLELEEV